MNGTNDILLEAGSNPGRKHSKIEEDFPDLPPVLQINNDGFLSQWCCKCGLRHIWHFHVVRGKRPEDDIIYISGFCDDTGTELRKFWERRKKRRFKK